MFQRDEKYTKQRGRDGRTRTTTDEQFFNAYEEQGIQPTYKSPRRQAERSVSESLENLDEDESATLPHHGKKQYRERDTDEVYTTTDTRHSSAPTQTIQTRRSLGKKLVKNKRTLTLIDPGILAARVRVSAINPWLMAWGLWLWATFQIPFAMISIIMFAIGAGLSAVSDAIASTWVGRQVQSLASAVTGALEYFGIDLSIFSPYSLAFVSGMVVIAIGLITIMSAIFAYSLGFINSFGGRGSAAKNAALLLCFLGYGLPIVNLLPWFLLYVLAVWRYPK